MVIWYFFYINIFYGVKNRILLILQSISFLLNMSNEGIISSVLLAAYQWVWNLIIKYFPSHIFYYPVVPIIYLSTYWFTMQRTKQLSVGTRNAGMYPLLPAKPVIMTFFFFQESNLQWSQLAPGSWVNSRPPPCETKLLNLATSWCRIWNWLCITKLSTNKIIK